MGPVCKPCGTCLNLALNRFCQVDVNGQQVDLRARNSWCVLSTLPPSHANIMFSCAPRSSTLLATGAWCAVQKLECTRDSNRFS